MARMSSLPLRSPVLRTALGATAVAAASMLFAANGAAVRPEKSPLPAAAASAKAADTNRPADPEMAARAAAQGWINLLQDPALADWQRLPLPSDATLDSRNPWHYDAASGVLQGDGTGLHELLTHRTPRGDGILRVEWRYTGDPAKPRAGIWVRTTADLATSHVAQLAPNMVGSLSGSRPSPDGGTRRLNSGSRRADLLRKAGEWNVIELVCVGQRLVLHFNGVITADWGECKVAAGRLGLEVDGSPIEFRAVKFRPLP